MLRSNFVMMLVVHTASARVCSICPENTTSEPGSYNLDACQCKPGWYGPNGGLCVQCDAGKYKTAAGSHICTPCPDDHISESGSFSPRACQCTAGYYQFYEGYCAPCGYDMYKPEVGPQSCTDCPLNTVSQPTSIVCQCMPGWYGPDGGPCTQCNAGTYKTASGSQICTPCPDNSGGSPVGSSRISQCVCNPGTHGRNGVRPYDLGYMSPPCTICLADTYVEAGGMQTFGNMCSSKKNYNGGVDPQCPSATATWVQMYPAAAGNDGRRDSLVELGNGNTWTVDFEMVRTISYVELWNDRANTERARGGEVRVGNSIVPRENPLCATLGGTMYDGSHVEINQVQTLDCFATGRYLSVIKDGEWMRFGEMTAFGRCQNCPRHSTSPDLAPNVDACRCMQGYGREHHGDIWICKTCGLGKYKA